MGGGAGKSMMAASGHGPGEVATADVAPAKHRADLEKCTQCLLNESVRLPFSKPRFEYIIVQVYGYSDVEVGCPLHASSRAISAEGAGSEDGRPRRDRDGGEANGSEGNVPEEEFPAAKQGCEQGDEATPNADSRRGEAEEAGELERLLREWGGGCAGRALAVQASGGVALRSRFEPLSADGADELEDGEDDETAESTRSVPAAFGEDRCRAEAVSGEPSPPPRVPISAKGAEDEAGVGFERSVQGGVSGETVLRDYVEARCNELEHMLGEYMVAAFAGFAKDFGERITKLEQLKVAPDGARWGGAREGGSKTAGAAATKAGEIDGLPKFPKFSP